ncbi:MAG: hypothetical protein HOW97_14735 [Catenulispora sp.]|nr:hypothetical protein [Catenulispora sp.]
MKLLVKTVASTAVVLVALAGCASRSTGGDNSAAGSGSDTSSSASPSGSTSTQNGSQPGAPSGGSSTGTSAGGQSGSPSGGESSSKPNDPNAQVKYVSPAGVSLDKDGITLVTEVTWGGCNDQPQLIIMSQDASKVVVELKQVNHQKVGVMCPDIAREGEAKAKLAAPLGSRQVIDGIKNVPITVH